MSDEKDKDTQLPADASRRRFLAGAAALGVGAATLNVYANTPHDTPVSAEPLTPTELDKKQLLAANDVRVKIIDDENKIKYYKAVIKSIKDKLY